MCAVEVLAVVGLLLYVCAPYIRALYLNHYGTFIMGLMAPGTTILHLLTCVERYLALVHPVTYRALKQIAESGSGTLAQGGLVTVSFTDLSV